MNNGEPNKTVPTGNEGNPKPTGDDKPTEEPKKDISKLDKLKADNDEFEKELVRGRELHAEAQKLEADKLMSGEAGGKVEVEEVDEDQVMADKLLADSE